MHAEFNVVCGNILVHACGNIWVHVYGFWVHVYSKTVGYKVCGSWVHLYGNCWVHVCGSWVQVYGAVGCMDAVVGCKSMERLGACLTVGSFA